MRPPLPGCQPGVEGCARNPATCSHVDAAIRAPEQARRLDTGIQRPVGGCQVPDPGDRGLTLADTSGLRSTGSRSHPGRCCARPWGRTRGCPHPRAASRVAGSQVTCWMGMVSQNGPRMRAPSRVGLDHECALLGADQDHVVRRHPHTVARTMGRGHPPNHVGAQLRGSGSSGRSPDASPRARRGGPGRPAVRSGREDRQAQQHEVHMRQLHQVARRDARGDPPVHHRGCRVRTVPGPPRRPRRTAGTGHRLDAPVDRCPGHAAHRRRVCQRLRRLQPLHGDRDEHGPGSHLRRHREHPDGMPGTADDCRAAVLHARSRPSPTTPSPARP